MDHIYENLTDVIRQRADVVVGHDAIHPDRSACGGIGNCALMRAEHDAEQNVNNLLDYAARKSYRIVVVEK